MPGEQSPPTERRDRRRVLRHVDIPHPEHTPARRDDHPGDGATRGTQRMEAFADGVFAIAFTLPVVELEMPEHNAPLAEELARLGPSFLGFALAASVIGIHWSHHHFSGAIYRTTGHWFNLATLLFLAAVAFIAYPARVLAESLAHPEHLDGAATFFAVSLAVTVAAWCLKWTVGRKMGHVDARLDDDYVRRLNLMYLRSTAIVILAAALSFFVPLAGLAMAGLVILYYVLPPTTPVYTEEAPTVEGEEHEA